MNPVQLTMHAQAVVDARAIRHEWIAATIAAPELIQPDSADRELMHALAKIPEFEKSYSARSVHSEHHSGASGNRLL